MSPLCLLLAFFSKGWIAIVFFAFAGTPLLLFVAVCLYFMKRDPDRLMSEDYNIQKQALTLIQEKGGEIQISPTSLPAVMNSPAQIRSTDAEDRS